MSNTLISIVIKYILSLLVTCFVKIAAKKKLDSAIKGKKISIGLSGLFSLKTAEGEEAVKLAKKYATVADILFLVNVSLFPIILSALVLFDDKPSTNMSTTETRIIVFIFYLIAVVAGFMLTIPFKKLVVDKTIKENKLSVGIYRHYPIEGKKAVRFVKVVYFFTNVLFLLVLLGFPLMFYKLIKMGAM